MTPEYTFTTFRPPDSPAAARAYHSAHEQALRRYGIGPLASSAPTWLNSPAVLVVLATAPNGQLAGGVRLHLATPTAELPLVKGLAATQPEVRAAVAFAPGLHVAEPCGLWVGAGHGGHDLGLLLTRYAVALAIHCDLDQLYCLAAPHTLGLVQALGFALVPEVGAQGYVAYPTPEYNSGVLVRSVTSPSADAGQQARLASLGERPTQSCYEQVGPERTVLVHYYCPRPLISCTNSSFFLGEISTVVPSLMTA